MSKLEDPKEVARRIMFASNSSCDVAMALEELTNLLVDANFHEEDEDDYDEDRLDLKAHAETVLFLIATSKIYGT